jgi:hypothetical protein
VIDALKAGAEPRAIEQSLADDLSGFLSRRQAFLLY